MSVSALWWTQIGAIACAFLAQLGLLWMGSARNEHVANAIVYLGVVSFLPYAIYPAASRSTTVRTATRSSECAAVGAVFALLAQVWMAFDLWARADSMAPQVWANSLAWIPWVAVFLGAGAFLLAWILVCAFHRISGRS